MGAVLAAGLLAACGQSAAGGPQSVSLETARADLEAGRVRLVDIREPGEHAQGVAPGARLLPMRQVEEHLAELAKDPQRPVYLICNTQNRSRATAAALLDRGLSHVRYVEGGMSGWVQRGWPLTSPGR